MPRSNNFIEAMVKGIHGITLELSDQEVNLHGFAENMHQAGISCAERIIADGMTHHFLSYGESKKDCWYKFDGTTGKYGDCNGVGGIYGK